MDAVEKRRKEEVDFINAKGEVGFAELKERFSGVSDMTLRTDLKQLDEERRIIRVHGGAKSVGCVIGNDERIQTRLVRNVSEKKEIAKKALSLVESHTCIFIDSGSTTTELARIFDDVPNIIYTSSLSVAAELSSLKEPEVYLPGGRLNPNSLSISGTAGIEELAGINFDLAFIGVTGYEKNGGFNSGSKSDTLLKKTVIGRASKVVALMDASKIGIRSTYSICDLSGVDIIVTSGSLPDEFVDACRQLDVVIM